MTYNEWRDELKSNLLSVSDNERRRVLDYYAEAYADRREAGFSEREIIEEFGAPYDAAQRILNENLEDTENDSRKNGNAEQPQAAEPATAAPATADSAPSSPPAPSEEPAPSSTPATKPKKKHTAAIVIGVISGILVLGVIAFIIISAISCSTKPAFTEAHYTQQAESIQTVKIDAAVGEVETVFYDGDKIEIDYHTSNIYDASVSEKNGTIIYKQKTKWWLMLRGTVNYPKTTIKLPESCVYNLSIDMSAGSTVINGGTYSNINIDLSAGKVSLLGEIVCDSLNIDTSAGTIEVGKVECAGSAKIDLSAGQVKIDEISCTDIIIDLSAGQVNIGLLNCPKIYVDLSAGTVKLGIVGQQSEYNIAVDKSAGSCNIGSQRGTDENKLIVIDLSAGSVTVNFNT